MNDALVACGYQPYKTEMYYTMVGHGMRILCSRAVENNSVKNGAGIKMVEECYQQNYLSRCCNHTKVYSGILSCLKELKSDGYILGVISNKPQTQVRQVMKLFPPDLFDFVQGQKVDVRPKPFPDSLQQKMTELRMPPQNVVYVGDSAVDIQFGKNAEVHVVGVLWGFRDKEELVTAGAEMIAENPRELFAQIKKLEEKFKKI